METVMKIDEMEFGKKMAQMEVEECLKGLGAQMEEMEVEECLKEMEVE